MGRRVAHYTLTGSGVKGYTEEMQIWMKSGADLERQRVARGLSPGQLAELAGLSDRSHIRKIERGKLDPRLSTVLKLTAALTEEVRDE